MRTPRRAVIAALLVLYWGSLARGAGEYPMKVMLERTVEGGGDDGHLDRHDRSRTADGGEPAHACDRRLEVQRLCRRAESAALAPAGGNDRGVRPARVDIKFAHEAADRRMGFDSCSWPISRCSSSRAMASKPKAGYKLTIVDLQVGAKGEDYRDHGRRRAREARSRWCADSR